MHSYFQHKLTTWFVKAYDVVAVEDLDVKPMLETSQSAKNKQDVRGLGSSICWNTKVNCTAHTSSV
ncbi:hypothetical protein GCM10009000_084560 [Halobacterium noricense]|uniref:Transposase n=1 Tax=Haladaptatus pallidirubidus TaxID=1008152 RepID=A0AAV3US10_9EURY